MEPILFPHDIRHSVWLFTPVLIDPGSRSRQISGTFSTGKMSFFSKKKPPNLVENSSSIFPGIMRQWPETILLVVKPYMMSCGKSIIGNR